MFNIKTVTTNVTCDKCGEKTHTQITGNKQTRKWAFACKCDR